ncbi:MAG: GspE/PulE family protein [Hyphomicrobium sp.]|nr:GspE/PulE family protein [Hyphomicrobium sp.]
MPLERSSALVQLPDPRSAEFTSALRQRLLDGGHVDELALRRAEKASQQSSERLDVVLARLGLVGETTLCEAVAGLLNIPMVPDGSWPTSLLNSDVVPRDFLLANRLVMVADAEDPVEVAVADPFNTSAIEALAFQLERPVTLRMAPPAAIERCLESLLGRKRQIAAEGAAPSEAYSDTGADDIRRLEDLASEAPVIRLAHDIIDRAVEVRASDVHIEPREDCVSVRYRIDGALQTVETLPVELRAGLTSRIKIMARLNIAERRLPQDGRVRFTTRGREIDLRVSTMPTIAGESVVLRILDRDSIPLEFAQLGFAGTERQGFEQLLCEPNGIILVTGPTGSGKSTTLYTALRALNQPDRKLFTVEDPIEYRLTGVNQIAVNPKISLTFASALRSILRQDPDIIMVGEIRDLETAEIAIRASLTGHLVLSTVHTNSAAATVTRLLDMGVEDYLLASSLKGVLAQRLVRTLCPGCSRPAEVPTVEIDRIKRLAGPAAIGMDVQLRKAHGCELCRDTGYRGRTAIYELLAITPRLRSTISASLQESAVQAAAVEAGMTTLMQNGLAKVLAGETTMEEILRVTRAEDASISL